MPKFNITAEFGLATTVEPEISGYAFDNNEVEDFTDNSYFDGGEVTSSGGSIAFVVEAEDEQAAENIAEGVIYEGYEVEDNNGLTWGVENVSIEVEAVEMSRDEAFVIVRRLLDRLVSENVITSEEREALDLVIQDS